MARGGARNRSGPPPDPNSERSERRGYKLTALPAEGYAGPVPDFPLPPRLPLDFEVDGAPVGELIRSRELELWEWMWRTPQACAWSMPSERWRLHTIALYARTFVICEGSEATAADKASLHRFADQIGMTTAGLAEMGWAIATDEVAEKAAERESSTERPKSSRDRMKVVGGDGA